MGSGGIQVHEKQEQLGWWGGQVAPTGAGGRLELQ